MGFIMYLPTRSASVRVLVANPTVYIEAGVAPPQDLLHKREVYKLVTKKQGENLPGKVRVLTLEKRFVLIRLFN